MLPSHPATYLNMAATISRWPHLDMLGHLKMDFTILTWGGAVPNARRGVHVGIVTGWVLAPALSQGRLMLFDRAQVSYLVMFIHVAFASSCTWRWHSSTARGVAGTC